MSLHCSLPLLMFGEQYSFTDFIFFLSEAELSEEATKLISASVDYLIEALQYLLNQHHDTSEHTLSKIMLIMTDLKQFDKI